MTLNTLNYVSQIGGNYLILHCESSELDEKIRNLGADHLISGDWSLGFSEQKQLASLLTELRDLGFSFAGGPAGWPPAAVFEELRDRDLLKGIYQEIVWISQNETQISTK